MASLKKRGKSYQIQYYVGGKQKRIGLGDVPYQVAKEKLRQFESAQARGDDLPFPTRTPIAEVVTAYVEYIRDVKTPKSAQTDIYYLREAFGPICEALQITSRRVTEKSRKRPRMPGQDRRCHAPVIEAECFEAITTAHVATFIHAHKRSRGLAPKTANRYREILVRLFNWAEKHLDVRMPAGKNPAARVERFNEPAPKIRYLTLQQIAQQLNVLSTHHQIQTMVATYIYAGLRREELLWLQCNDIDLWSSSPRIRIRAKSIGQMSWQPKTRRNRAIPISPDLRTYLTGYEVPHSSDGLFFPSPQGHRWDPDNFSSTLRDINTKNALTWTCLDYRHTFGSQLAQAGISLFQIAFLMGNSPSVCQRHYAALSLDGLQMSARFPKSETAYA